MKAITTNHLAKYYGKSRGIVDISFSVDEGDFFGFIGSNGAGKSTTIRILLGLITATSGLAEIFGQDVKKHKTSILRKIGYMPSEASLYSSMRVKDIICLSAGLRKMDCKAEAQKLCNRLELDTSKKIRELSLGNRKKVCIVCAMQHKPELYILDEPASGLDPLMQHEFYSILKERNKEGATIFLSSHILSEIQRYCKYAAIIREGKLLLSDSVERLGHTGVKRITLQGVDSIPRLEHIKDVKAEQGTISFLYSGEPVLLLKALSILPITDITVTEPDLEEVFMHYYAKEKDGYGNI